MNNWQSKALELKNQGYSNNEIATLTGASISAIQKVTAGIEKPWRTNTCKVCGKEFQSPQAKKYCSHACNVSVLANKAPTVNKKPCPITELTAEARRQGMTYGQFVAKMETAL